MSVPGVYGPDYLPRGAMVAAGRSARGDLRFTKGRGTSPPGWGLGPQQFSTGDRQGPLFSKISKRRQKNRYSESCSSVQAHGVTC